MCSLWGSANIRIRFGLQIVLVCLYNTPSHYHHCANLSDGIKLIKCLSDIFCRVCKIKHFLSVIHYTICGAVCFHFFCDDCENIYTLSYHHHQIGSMNYYPLFRVRSWNNGVHCMSFYIRLNILYTIIDIFINSAKCMPVLDWNLHTERPHQANEKDTSPYMQYEINVSELVWSQLQCKA